MNKKSTSFLHFKYLTMKILHFFTKPFTIIVKNKKE